MTDWIVTSWTAVGGVLLSAFVVYVVLITYTRLAGLRSFSKMSGFDFAMTVAIGSIVASSVLTKSPPLAQALVGLGAIYLLQITAAVLRKRFGWFSNLVDNEPLVLMTQEGMVEENLRRARVTEDDVWAKLREANVLTIAEVRAVVFESTGDISVLHGPEDGETLEACLLSGVRDAERVETIDRGHAERYV
jgi:uncharacterized membrane protein YcaP (DUF421 family)